MTSTLETLLLVPLRHAKTDLGANARRVEATSIDGKPSFAALGLRELPIAIVPKLVTFDALAPTLLENDARLVEVPGVAQVFVVRQRWSIGDDVDPLRIAWPEYWLRALDVGTQNYEAFARARGLSARLEWVSVLSIVTMAQDPPPLDALMRVTQMNDQRSGQAQAAGVACVSGWDGGLFVLDSRVPTVSAAVVAAIHYVTAADWEAHALASQELAALLAGLRDTALTARRAFAGVRSISRHLFWVQATLDPDILCWVSSDVAIADAMWRGWGNAGLRERTCRTLDQVTRVLELDASDEEARSRNRTNAALELLAVLGVAGTAASVIAAVDFSNHVLSSELTRLAAVVFCCIFTLSAFLLVSRGARRR